MEKSARDRGACSVASEAVTESVPAETPGQDVRAKTQRAPQSWVGFSAAPFDSAQG
jgi:hypothetical protein